MLTHTGRLSFWGLQSSYPVFGEVLCSTKNVLLQTQRRLTTILIDASIEEVVVS